MRSVLLSNIPHYHHLAEALHGAGLLKRYITTTCLIGDEASPWMAAAGLRHRAACASQAPRYVERTSGLA